QLYGLSSSRSESGEIPAVLEDCPFGEAVQIKLLHLRRISLTEEACLVKRGIIGNQEAASYPGDVVASWADLVGRPPGVERVEGIAAFLQEFRPNESTSRGIPANLHHFSPFCSKSK
ncbi:hypothetical protein, partial [Paenibacillus thiaminolyticus]|uniref:hypothetical protein n=1 Tax=Paenibacillus thiaminolyticus TaxID=49283 RepID=UPI002282153F